MTRKEGRYCLVIKLVAGVERKDLLELGFTKVISGQRIRFPCSNGYGVAGLRFRPSPALGLDMTSEIKGPEREDLCRPY